jgi:hypothetical protein
MSDNTPWGALAMWSLDFIRAVRERPLLSKILFRLVIGKYAYREFIGMMDTFQYAGYSPYFDYSCETVGYHKDKIPFINWWAEREGLYNRESTRHPQIMK